MIKAILLLLLGFHSTCYTFSGVKVTNFKNHPGLYFENWGKVNMVTSKWHVVTHFNVKWFWEEADKLKLDIDALRIFCYEAQYKAVVDSYLRRMDDILAMNELIKKECNFKMINGSQVHKKKRSYFNVIGSLANTLFGVLDEEYARKLEKVIEGIKSNERHTLSLIRNHTTIIESTLAIINKDFKNIQTNFDFMEEAIKQAKRDEMVIFRKLSFHTAAHYLNMVLNKYRETQLALHDSLMDFKNKDINSLLIPSDELERELKEITKTLPHGYHFPSTRVEELEAIIDVAVVFGTNELMFIIEIPLLKEMSFSIFKMIPLPTKVGSLFGYIAPTDDYIAVNMKAKEYYFLDQLEFSKCKKFKNSFICFRDRPSFIMGEYNRCEISLFLQKPLTEAYQCQWDIANSNQFWVQLRAMNTWIFSIKTEVNARVECAEKFHHELIKGEGVIQILPGCSIVIGDTKISSIEIRDTHVTLESHLSILPSLNWSAWNPQNFTQDLKLISLSDTTSISKQLKAVKIEEKKNVDDFVPPLDIHHYFMYSAISIILIIILVIYVYFKYFVK